MFNIPELLIAFALAFASWSSYATSTSEPEFQGRIDLAVSAADTNHAIFSIQEKLVNPSAGPLTLLYPEWDLASHAPTASVAELAGLVIYADRLRIEWHRDPVRTHAFHLNVPRATKDLTVRFDFLSPRSEALLRPHLIKVPWYRLVLYPAGYSLKSIPVDVRLTIPQGLHPFTSLDLLKAERATLIFAPTNVADLLNAPLYAGRYWLRRDLGQAGRSPVFLDVLSEQAAAVSVSIDEEKKLREMVTQTSLIFGPAPFPHYDAIVTLSDALSPGGGIEHAEEGENNLPTSYFSNLRQQLMTRDLIVHEFVHAWNGCFRLPAGLWSPDLNSPVQDSMLWVYEGQTEFWARVLAARSRLRTYQETLDRLAMDAALVAGRSARAWKSLADSNNDPLFMSGHSVAWRDWQRREDYYPEGVLLWLDVDARLRELTNNQRGLDDFAHRFFATEGRPDQVRTYTFPSVCQTLNAIANDNWAGRLQRHLDTHENTDAMEGLARAGWRLRYDESPTETFYQDEAESGVSNLDDSIGLQVQSDGTVRSVVWHSPAFEAGLAPGVKITAINNHPFSSAEIKGAVKTASSSVLRLTFLVNAESQSVIVAYHGTLRYPHLEHIPGSIDRLTPLLQPRS